MLRLRHDVTYRTRSEIDNVLAEIEAKDNPSGAADAKTEVAATPAAGATAPIPPTVPTTVSAGATTDGGSNKRLILIGGAALAVIAVIAIVVVLTTQGGKTKPASKANPNSNSAVNSAPASTPNAPANPAPSAKLDSYLIGATDIGAIIADPALVAGESFSQPRSPRWSLSVPECAGTYEPAVASVYQGANGLTAISGAVAHDPGQDQPHRVIESVAEFSTADQAGAFIQASADKWKACVGKTVTETLNGRTFDWHFADVDGAPPKIAQERTRSDNAKTCHHVLHAASNIVIDVTTCGPQAGAGEAGKIAQQISTKIGA
jgi:hypothetical protein